MIAIVVAVGDEIHFAVDKILNLIDDIVFDDDENVVVAVTMMMMNVIAVVDVEKMIVEVEMVDEFVHSVLEEYSFH